MTNPAWVTHLLRIVIANFVVECILRAKTLQLHLTRMGRWRDPTKYQEATIAIASAEWKNWNLTLPFQPSHIAPKLTDCENRAKMQEAKSSCLKTAWWFLGLPHPITKSCHEKWSRYVDPASQIDITECHRRLCWLQNYDIPCSPLLKLNANKMLEVLHLFRRFTHTHTRPAAAGWMKWQWKWDGHEHEMTDCLTGTRDGERKRRQEKRRKHQHQHT